MCSCTVFGVEHGIKTAGVVRLSRHGSKPTRSCLSRGVGGHLLLVRPLIWDALTVCVGVSLHDALLESGPLARSVRSVVTTGDEYRPRRSDAGRSLDLARGHLRLMVHLHTGSAPPPLVPTHRQLPS